MTKDSASQTTHENSAEENRLDANKEKAEKEGAQEEIEELKKLLNAKDAEIKELKNQMLYLLSDFENYRKRKEREAGELKKHAQVEFMKNLLPFLDTLDAMEINIENASSNVLAEGLLGLKKNFFEILTKMGLSEIQRESFDPRFHEVEAVIPADTDGRIIEIVRKGYVMDGVVLRPARVIIGKKEEGKTE
ncbi:MAG: nucleotide exchange factor GrpE [Thermoplasmata archaeon]